jgi:cell division initiation protein
MALTPQDVEQKTFSTALRGYDLDEVDDFLDEIVTTLRDLHEKLAEAESAPASAAPEAPREEPAPVVDESAVGRVLVTAQQTADTIVAEAKSEAETIVEGAKTEAETTLEEARSEADTWLEQRQAKRAEAEAEMAELAQHVAGVRTKLAVLANAVADRLEEMDETIESNVADTDGTEGAADADLYGGEVDDEGTSEGEASGEDEVTMETQGDGDEPEDDDSADSDSHEPEIFVIGGNIDEDEDHEDEESTQSDDSSGDRAAQEEGF